MKPLTSLFLIGPMGAGKSTVGRLLAKKTNNTFIDSDEEIEHRSGASISWIFDKEGEEGFRRREQAMIDELTQRQKIVLATGGGTIIQSNNRQHLSGRGYVVYLYTSVEKQWERTQSKQHRPLLQQENAQQVLLDLFLIRDPLYSQVADITVNTDYCNAMITTLNIMRQLKNFDENING
jgi:shikimate kinase